MSNIEIIISKTGTVIDNRLIKNNLTFIRIENRSSSLYLKAITQYNHHILAPIIKMRQLSHVFLNSISVNILERINWSVNESVYVQAISKNTPPKCSKSISISYDNPPILQFMYHILDKLNINTSDLNDNPLGFIFLRKLLS